MAHPRQDIRDAIVTACTGLPDVGDNIYNSRVYRISPSRLPSIVVWTRTERSEPDTMKNTDLLKRELDVIVDVFVKPGDNTEDDLDDIAVEVEKAIGADRTLGGFALDTYLERSHIEFEGEGEKVLGVLSMTWRTMYYTYIDDPERSS